MGSSPQSRQSPARAKHRERANHRRAPHRVPCENEVPDCSTRRTLHFLPASSAAISGQPSHTLFIAGFQSETSLSPLFETLCEREKKLQTSPNIHLPNMPGRWNGLGASTEATKART